MVPHHIAIIMDGNNRWAKRHSLPGAAGHRAGVEAIRNVIRACNNHGVKVLTLFAFSSQNWSRPTLEIQALMSLLGEYVKRERPKIMENDIRSTIRRDIGGDQQRAPRIPMGYLGADLEPVAGDAPAYRITRVLAGDGFDLDLVLFEEWDQGERTAIEQLTRDLAENALTLMRSDPSCSGLMRSVVCLRMNPTRVDFRLRFGWRV